MTFPTFGELSRLIALCDRVSLCGFNPEQHNFNSVKISIHWATIRTASLRAFFVQHFSPFLQRCTHFYKCFFQNYYYGYDYYFYSNLNKRSCKVGIHNFTIHHRMRRFFFQTRLQNAKQITFQFNTLAAGSSALFSQSFTTLAKTRCL